MKNKTGTQDNAESVLSLLVKELGKNLWLRIVQIDFLLFTQKFMF